MRFRAPAVEDGFKIEEGFVSILIRKRIFSMEKFREYS
jgi:hypothetical protein